VQNIEDPACPECRSGIGILAHASNDVVVSNLLKITANSVTAFKEAGIVLDNAPGVDVSAGGGLAAAVGDNVVAAAPNGVIVQDGIRVSNGATATVSGNNVSGTAYVGIVDPSQTAAAVRLDAPAAGAVISGNQLSTFDVGVDALDAPAATISGNTLVGGRS